MKPKRKLTQEDVREIQEMYRIGLSLTYLAKAYNMTPPAIRYHIIGLERRPISEVKKFVRTSFIDSGSDNHHRLEAA